MSNKIVFVNGKSKCGCVMAFSDGGGEYSDVHTIIPCAEHSMPESALTQRDDMRQAREQLAAAEKRNAELREYYGGVIADGSKRIAELEAKLSKPVLLPKTNGYWNEQEKAYEEAITLARRQIRLAGFRCEGDE